MVPRVRRVHQDLVRPRAQRPRRPHRSVARRAHRGDRHPVRGVGQHQVVAVDRRAKGVHPLAPAQRAHPPRDQPRSRQEGDALLCQPLRVPARMADVGRLGAAAGADDGACQRQRRRRRRAGCGGHDGGRVDAARGRVPLPRRRGHRALRGRPRRTGPRRLRPGERRRGLRGGDVGAVDAGPGGGGGGGGGGGRGGGGGGGAGGAGRLRGRRVGDALV